MLTDQKNTTSWMMANALSPTLFGRYNVLLENVHRTLTNSISNCGAGHTVDTLSLLGVLLLLPLTATKVKTQEEIKRHSYLRAFVSLNTPRSSSL